MNSSPSKAATASPPGNPVVATVSTKKLSGSSLLVKINHSPTDADRNPQPPTHTLREEPRIVFGSGAISRLPAELGNLRIAAPIIVSSPSRLGLARRIQGLIPNLNSHILDSAVINVQNHVVDDAVERITGRDAVISVGGSSAVGLGRAISIRKGIPHICIPTNYSGFEVTPLLEVDAASMAGNAGSARSISSPQSSEKNSSGKTATAISGSGKNSSNKTTTGSRASSKNSITVRDARSRTKPAVIIYDEDLTALTSKRIPAPLDEILLPASNIPRSRRFSADDAEWSFLQLP